MSARAERGRASVLLGCAVLLAACSEAERAHDFRQLAGPDGSVVTTTVVEPWFPQGPHQVVVYVQPTPAAPRVEVARTTLAYDGVPFTEANINMSFTGQHAAIVCLRATDRPDRSVVVDTRQPPQGALRDGC